MSKLIHQIAFQTLDPYISELCIGLTMKRLCRVLNHGRSVTPYGVLKLGQRVSGNVLSPIPHQAIA